MNPVANEICRVPLRRCLERTHHYTRGAGHMVPSSFMISNLLPVLRLKDAVRDGAEGKISEWGEGELTELEDEDEYGL